MSKCGIMVHVEEGEGDNEFDGGGYKSVKKNKVKGWKVPVVFPHLPLHLEF